MSPELLTPDEVEESTQKQMPARQNEPVLWADVTQEEPPIWRTLYENVRDTFFAPKLPPLELTSQPIPVPDLLAEKRSPWPKIISTAVNCFLLALIIVVTLHHVLAPAKKPLAVNVTDLSEPVLPIAKGKISMGGGGGGGTKDILQATKGRIPPPSLKPQITPPTVKPPEIAKLEVPPTVNMQNLKLPNANLPNFGTLTGTVTGPLSNGTGTGGGIGNGTGTGVGSGNGNGVGPGTGGNIGGGIFRIGNGVSAPELIFQPEPEFSDEARKAKYQGICNVYLIVDATGTPRNVRVVRPIGMGLDEKALDAVRRYKFKPAMKDGKPVAVALQVEVDFHIY